MREGADKEGGDRVGNVVLTQRGREGAETEGEGETGWGTRLARYRRQGSVGGRVGVLKERGRTD